MTTTPNAPLTQDDFLAFHQDLEGQPAADVISRAVMNNGVNAASQDPQAQTRLNRTFSVEVPTGAVTN